MRLSIFNLLLFYYLTECVCIELINNRDSLSDVASSKTRFNKGFVKRIGNEDTSSLIRKIPNPAKQNADEDLEDIDEDASDYDNGEMKRVNDQDKSVEDFVPSIEDEEEPDEEPAEERKRVRPRLGRGTRKPRVNFNLRRMKQNRRRRTTTCLPSTKLSPVENKWNIVSGDEVTIEDFPYHALVSKYHNTTNRTACGGTIFTRQHVLTAGHCVVNGDQLLGPEHFTIRVGSLYHSKDGHFLNAERSYLHPKYNRSHHMFFYDIAVIKTKGEIPFGTKVSFAILAQPDEKERFLGMLTRHEMCTLVGWGGLQFNTDKTEPALRKIDLSLLPIDQCSFFQSTDEEKINKDIHVCTLSVNKDACRGDGGAGLICGKSLDVQRVWGVVSFGQECGMKANAAVFTRVDALYDFIYDAATGGSSARSHLAHCYQVTEIPFFPPFPLLPLVTICAIILF